MPIGVNPDTRQLDFFDDVRVSKFMREQEDFKAKKWIRYATANAPSSSKPFEGGTYQFDTHMGVGHIIDTHYSGFYYTIRFEVPHDGLEWSIAKTLPRTSCAWIYQSSVNHTNVPSNLNPRLHDFDCVNTLFTDPIELETEEMTYMHLRPSEEKFVGYGYPLLANPLERYPVVKVNSSAEVTFFIPLKNVNTIFNSNRYFFTNLLRGNGEFIIYLTSRAESLSSIFGGADTKLAVGKEDTGALDPNHADIAKVKKWKATMVDLYLMTLNVDNDFINKEYNAFVYSGRKFVRSFKSYNCITKVVYKNRLNVIEIAHTHQSISHVAIVFDNGKGACLERISRKPGDLAKGARVYIHPSCKQYFTLGNMYITDFQVYRGTGNNEVMFSTPINNMDELRRLTLEAIGNNGPHPYFTRKWATHDGMAVIVVSLNTFMREVSKTFWDGFSTTQTSDRLRIEFIPKFNADIGVDSDLGGSVADDHLNCYVFAFFDNVYYVDQQHCLNVTDTLNAIG